MRTVSKLHSIVLYSVFAALMCVLSPIALPVTTPPITLSVFVICCISSVIGRMSWISVILYLILGACGIPVFSFFTGGIGVLTGASGGFLMGYIPLAVSVGMAAEKCKNVWQVFAFSIMGLAILYAVGGVWYSYTAEVGLLKGFLISVLPFVLPDMIKVYLGILCGKKIKSLIKRV